jgi:hypothetical protein
VDKISLSRCWWLTSVIPDTWEAKIGRTMVPCQHRQKPRPYLKNNLLVLLLLLLLLLSSWYWSLNSGPCIC